MIKKFISDIALFLIVILFTFSVLESSNKIISEYSRKDNPIISLQPVLKSNQKSRINNRIGLGVYLTDVEETKYKSFVEFEDLIGRKMLYTLMFKAWGDLDSNFPLEDFKYIQRLNLVPIITWEPWKRDFSNPNIIQPEYSLDSIVLGMHDNYITNWANDAKEAESKVIIRFAHEMTTPRGQQIWYPWQGEPEKYIQAFRRIVDIFNKQGATNVEFMWNPLMYMNLNDYSLYYPGEDYVDYIGLSVINLGETIGTNGEDYNWKTCTELLAYQYAQISPYNKPVIIAELISNEIGGNKSEWYSECFSYLESLDKIVGINLVQISAEKQWSNIGIDYRIDSTLSSLETFKSLLFRYSNLIK